MVNLTWVGDPSTVYSLAAEQFLLISRRHWVTGGECRGGRSRALPTSPELLRACQMNPTTDKQAGPSPYPCGEFLDPPMF